MHVGLPFPCSNLQLSTLDSYSDLQSEKLLAHAGELAMTTAMMNAITAVNTVATRKLVKTCSTMASFRPKTSFSQESGPDTRNPMTITGHINNSRQRHRSGNNQ